MDKLLPCPFCGGNPSVPMMAILTCVFCLSCGARTASFESEVEAVDHWNHRPEPGNDPLTLEQLRAMDQKPVWVKEITTSPIDWDYWGIVDVDFACAGNWGTGAVISPATDGQSRFAQTPFSDYGSTWLAYRHPPKER